MRILWLVPSLPMPTFDGQVQDLQFAGTVGWCWEEAMWAGSWLVPGCRMVISDPRHQNDNMMPDIIVVSPEGIAPPLVGPLLSLPDTVDILLRCVAPPADGALAWEALLPLVPRLRGMAFLSDREAEIGLQWASRAGFKGKIGVVPLGAVEQPRSSMGRGVAYIGRLIPEKRADIVMDAAQLLPRIPFLFVIPMGSEEKASLELQQRGNVLQNVSFVTCGARGRIDLLQKVRAVVTASMGDSQWLPGTEIRGAHGVGIAQLGTGVESWNGNGLLYHSGTPESLAGAIQRVHEDSFFVAEAERQHAEFVRQGLQAQVVGARLLAWIRASVE